MSLDVGCDDGHGHHKRSYTKRGAKRSLKWAQQQGGRAMNVYRGRCGEWHIGHPNTHRDEPVNERGTNSA